MSNVKVLQHLTLLSVKQTLDARGVRLRSTRKKIQSYSFHIASTPDLIRMKEIAASNRNASTDLQDLEFLKRI